MMWLLLFNGYLHVWCQLVCVIVLLLYCDSICFVFVVCLDIPKPALMQVYLNVVSGCVFCLWDIVYISLCNARATPCSVAVFFCLETIRTVYRMLITQRGAAFM